MQNHVRSLLSGGSKSHSKSTNKYLAFFSSSGLVLSLLLMGSCGNKNENHGWGDGPAELPIAVVQQGEAIIPKEYAASVEGVQNVEIQSQVTGYLSKIYVDEGAYVNAGQTLFKIEDKTYAEQLRSAQASLITAQANLANAQIELNRKKELVKSKVVSDLQVQQAEAAYNASRGAVSQASSQLESAKINLNFCTIKAPVSGYVGRFNYRLGSLISPTNTTPLTLLSDIRQVNVYFSMSENDFSGFQQEYGGKVENAPAVNLITSSGNQYELPGKIDAVEGQFNQNTGSITLRARFNNPKLLLRSGNTGKISIVQRYANATLLPIASTIMIQDKIFIFSVDKDSKAIQLPIEVSGKSGNNYIVSKGINPGDKYIVSGFDRLQAGAPVVAQKANANPNK